MMAPRSHARGRKLATASRSSSPIQIVAPILLRGLRDDRKISLGEMANRLGITWTYQRFERRSNLALKTFSKAMKALNCAHLSVG